MATNSTTTTPNEASARKATSAASVDVKAELRSLTESTSSWSSVDAEANGLLYNLLGRLYELTHKLAKDKDIAALREECKRRKHIRQSKMWKIDSRPVLELLIAYTIGTDSSKAATRSQWKNVIREGKSQKVPFDKKAFSIWLRKRGGIEGVLSKGRHKSPNKAVEFRFDELSARVGAAALSRQLVLDLTNTPSYSDSTFKESFCLALVTQVTDPDTGKSTHIVVDVVNSPDLVAKAAQIVNTQGKPKH